MEYRRKWGDTSKKAGVLILMALKSTHNSRFCFQNCVGDENQNDNGYEIDQVLVLGGSKSCDRQATEAIVNQV